MTADPMPTASLTCVCGQEFKSEMELEDHAREAHGAMNADDVLEFKCPECGSVFGTYAQLAEHWPSHGAVPDRPGHGSS